VGERAVKRKNGMTSKRGGGNQKFGDRPRSMNLGLYTGFEIFFHIECTKKKATEKREPRKVKVGKEGCEPSKRIPVEKTRPSKGIYARAKDVSQGGRDEGHRARRPSLLLTGFNKKNGRMDGDRGLLGTDGSEE